MDSNVREWRARLAWKFAAATVNGALVSLSRVTRRSVATPVNVVASRADR